MIKITQKLATTLMDCLACLQYSAKGTIDEEEVRKIFCDLCDKYGIDEVEDKKC